MIEAIKTQDSILEKVVASESEHFCAYDICDGSGWVATDEFDQDSGRCMAGVGEQKCLCKLQEEADNIELYA